MDGAKWLKVWSLYGRRGNTTQMVKGHSCSVWLGLPYSVWQSARSSPLLQHLAYYYMGYRGRLNKSSKSMVESFKAGKLWPESGDPSDSQANALVKVRNNCIG